VNRRAPLIAAGVAALLAVLLVFLLVLPKMSEVGEVEDDLTAAQDQELALEAQLRALQDAQQAAPETEAQIAAIEEQVPPTVELPELITILQGAADVAAVDFFSFSPGTPITDAGGQFSTILSQITVTGSYFQIDEFLFRMETLPRAAKVTSVTIAPGAGTGPGTTSASALSMQMTIEFYTTDISAGPASQPGPTGGATSAPTGATGPAGTTGEPT
jgi:Tfp pilus assembly protein PilO